MVRWCGQAAGGSLITGAQERVTKKRRQGGNEEEDGMPKWQKSSDPAGLVYVLHLLSSSRLPNLSVVCSAEYLAQVSRNLAAGGPHRQSCNRSANRTRGLRSGLARGQTASQAGVPTARPSALGTALSGWLIWLGLLVFGARRRGRVQVNHRGDGMKGARHACAWLDAPWGGRGGGCERGRATRFEPWRGHPVRGYTTES